MVLEAVHLGFSISCKYLDSCIWSVMIPRVPLARLWAPDYTYTPSGNEYIHSILRVVHFSSHDVVGGAARATYRLHRALLAKDVQSRLVVCRKSSSDSSVSTPVLSPSFIGRIERRLRRANLNASARAIAAARPRDQDGFHADHGLFGNELVRQAMDADVVHLHWINDFIELPTFLPAVARLKPVVWTHHDLHGITGGCHYPKGCQNWKTGCVQCPQLTLAPTSSLAATIWSRQNATIASCPPNSLHLIAARRKVN